VYQPTGGSMGISSRDAQPTSKENVDFFNLGIGFSTTPSQVSLEVHGGTDGVAYTGTFTYRILW